MPVPAGPRRAAPPRKRVAKPVPPAPVADEEPKPNVPDDAQTAAVSPNVLPVPVPVSHDETADSPIQIIAEATDESDPALVTEHADISIVKDEPIKATLAMDDELTISNIDTIVQSTPLAESVHDDATSIPPTVEPQHQPEFESSPPAAETKAPEGLPVDEPEEEEESEETRRKRIAERLAKSGGAFNPFAGPPPPQRKPSLSPSVTSPGLESAPAEDVPRRTNVRKASTDSTTSVSPRAEKRASLRQSSTDINASPLIERRTSVRQNSTDSASQAPPLSPKPAPKRGDSFGSALSHGDTTIRKASLDGDGKY